MKNCIILSKTAIVAITTCLVCAFVFCASSALKAKQLPLSPVERHIVLTNEIDADSVLSKYDDATFTINGTTGIFDGYQNLDPSIFNEIDNISVDSLTDEENKTVECRVHYTYTYDVETSVVTICAEMNNEYGEIEIDNLQGVAFTDDNGNIDAILTLDDGETILLSDLVDNSVIDNVGWLSRLFKVAVGAVVGLVARVLSPIPIGVTAVVSIVSASMVEKTKANSNYEHNSKIEQPSNYINGQKNYYNWRFGINTLNNNGCGVIATYNAMLKLGKVQKLCDVIFEIESKSGTLALGAFGMDPTHWRTYFNSHNVALKEYYSVNSFENAIKNMSSNQCALLCFKNNKDNISKGYHDTAFIKDNNGKYEVFNRYNNSSSSVKYNTLNDILTTATEHGEYYGKFILGIIVG